MRPCLLRYTRERDNGVTWYTTVGYYIQVSCYRPGFTFSLSLGFFFLLCPADVAKDRWIDRCVQYGFAGTEGAAVVAICVTPKLAIPFV